MSNVEIHYDELPYVDGELDLADDRSSCKLFLAAVLDCARGEHVERLSFCPSDGNQSLRLVVGRDVFEMVPLPAEVCVAYLRFIQEMVLGKFAYFFLVRCSRQSFVRDNCGSVLVDVGARRSKWLVNCTRESVCFVRVQ